MSGRILVRGGRVLDPSQGLDREADLLLEDGRVAALNPGSAGDARVLDASGALVLPGLIDMHVHLREPGNEEEETIASGAAAAAAGGFTAVACMPNTEPAIDNEASAEFVALQAARAGKSRVFPIGAITLGRQGRELAEMGGLARAGAVAFSDEGSPVVSSEVMRRGLLYARMFDRPIITHAEDLELSGGGVMNAGAVSTRLGLSGYPRQAEEIAIARDIALCEMTGSRLHVAHLSTAGGLDLVRAAKARGLHVTAEVCPHHLVFTDEAVRSFDTNYKMSPPLRTARDVQALRAGLADGSIDAIASDHAPHAAEEKDVEFPYAPNGVVGLETTLPVVLTELVRTGVLDLARAVEAMTSAPARILGLDRADRSPAGARLGTLAPGAAADVTVVDLDAVWTIDKHAFLSKSRNTPFHGRAVQGRVLWTIVGGRVAHEGAPRAGGQPADRPMAGGRAG